MRLVTTAVLTAILSSAAPAGAATHTIYVAPRDSAAAAAAQARANGSTVLAERTLQRGLDQAVQILAKPGPQEVDLLLAEGNYQGRAGAGIWEVAPINNPAASFRIAGGFSADWSRRAPFETPSQLVTAEGRGGPFLTFGRGSKLQSLTLSGLVFDSAPSNAYDAKTNSLLKAQSRTYPILAFSMMTTDHLVVADNVFINGPHGAFEPAILPASTNTVVDIQNNFFINNVKTMMIGPNNPATRTPIRQVNLRGNTFVLNWPFNPDPTSSNVGAVELYHRNSATTLNIEGNLFAYNPGGAFQQDWPPNRMPVIHFRRNLFFTNATLFGDKKPEAGPLVGKFGANPRHLVLTLAAMEDDFDYKLEGNVVLDPQIKVDYALSVNPGKGDDVDLSGFAPRVDFNVKTLPFPANPAARGFGVQPGQALAIK